MSDNVKDAIKFAYGDNASNFQDSVDSILMDKLRDRIEVEKVAVAQKFFNEPDTAVDQAPEEELEQEEVTDEDV